MGGTSRWGAKKCGGGGKWTAGYLATLPCTCAVSPFPVCRPFPGTREKNETLGQGGQRHISPSRPQRSVTAGTPKRKLWEVWRLEEMFVTIAECDVQSKCLLVSVEHGDGFHVRQGLRFPGLPLHGGISRNWARHTPLLNKPPTLASTHTKPVSASTENTSAISAGSRKKKYISEKKGCLLLRNNTKRGYCLRRS